MVSVELVIGYGTRTLYRHLTLAACPRSGDYVEWDSGWPALFVDDVIIGPEAVRVSSRRSVNSQADYLAFRKAGWESPHEPHASQQVV
jgi:hypothetical protein